MASITLFTTAKSSIAKGLERQLALRSEDLPKLGLAGQAHEVVVLTPKGAKMTLTRRSSNSIFVAHQKGESLASFETLWAILSTRPDQTLTLELESVGEVYTVGGGMAPIPMGSIDF